MIKVIGLGNKLRGDDGIGPLLIEELEKQNLDSSFKLMDVGADAFTVLEHLLEKEPVIIVDCARMGKEPGEIVKIPLDTEKLGVADGSISLHGYSLAEIIKIAENTGLVAKGSIIGIEPEAIEFNTDLSPIVAGKLSELVKIVIEEANKYGKENHNH